MRLLILVFSLCTFIHEVMSQSFYDSSSELNIEHSYNVGYNSGGVSFADWDKNGWDDLTICQNGEDPQFYRNENGVFTQISNPIPENSEELTSVVWVDFDNDNDRDLFTTSYYGNYRLYQNDGGILYDISAEAGFPQTEDRTYSSSWGDYNNDGFLDVYISNYQNSAQDVENKLYKNNGDGTFEDVTEVTSSGDGSNFSFQALWIDYNNDGWQDLFVINDRLLSSNSLYRNDGGTFTDVSEESNMDFVIFSMSNTGGDYDNDGDLDIYITNNPTGHLLHRNNNDGTFSEIAEQAGVAAYDMGWAAQWIDFDLDGWQDLHVCCSPFWDNPGQNKFYKNNSDGTFDFDLSIGFEGDEGWSHSSAVGDYNNDGSFDLFVVQDDPDISKMWTAIPGDNNYLKVNLEGVVSNRDGIGSRIELYSEGQMQIRYSYCGEGYLSQNTFSEIFGLGTSTVIDSLKVKWLSGHIDNFYGIEANQTLYILEGSSLQNEIVYSGQDSICPGDSILLQAGDYPAYLWSTGDTTSSIYASIQGNYSVDVQSELGLTIQSNTLTIITLPEPINEVSTSGIVCYGESTASAWVENSGGTGIQEVIWDGEQTGDTLYSISAGMHSSILTDLNGCSAYSEFEIFQTDEIIVDIETTDALCYGDSTGTVTAVTSGGIGETSINWNGINGEFLHAGEYSFVVTDSMLCSITSTFEIFQPDSLNIILDVIDADEGSQGSASIVINGGTSPYTTLWSTDEDTEDIENLAQGDYSVTVTDFNDCEQTLIFSIVNVGVSEFLNDQILIYPNPFNEKIKLEFGNEKPDYIRVYNCIGELILSIKYTTTQEETSELDFSSLEDGLYFLGLFSDQETILFERIFKIKSGR